MLILRLGVVAICVGITVYQGYSCTEKYIGKPVTTEESLKSVAEFPELRMSVCKQLTVQECSAPEGSFFSMFNDYNDYEEEECVFAKGTVPNYAASYDEFWAEHTLKNKTKDDDGDEEDDKIPYKIVDFIRLMEVWNKSKNDWDVLVDGEFTDESLFRIQFDVHHIHFKAVLFVSPKLPKLSFLTKS